MSESLFPLRHKCVVKITADGWVVTVGTKVIGSGRWSW